MINRGYIDEDKRKKYNLPPLNIRYSDGPFKKYETGFKDGNGKERTYSSIKDVLTQYL